MLTDCKAVATIPVSDISRARDFYVHKLGLKPSEDREEEMRFECADGTMFGVFVSTGQTSGTHTQMGFMTDDIEGEVAELRAEGVEFETVEMPGATERDGIYEIEGERGAWFRDPDGNLLAVTEHHAS